MVCCWWRVSRVKPVRRGGVMRGADEGADTSVLMGSGMKEPFDSPTSLLRL